MNIFVIGNRGQLGSDLMQVLADGHDVRGMDLPELDITDPASIERALGQWPDALVNCAAYTAVDGCESDPLQAQQVNANGPANLAAHAQAHTLFLLHVSTDYVFDGRKPVPDGYDENAPTAPSSVYGKSKLAGEDAVRNAGCAFAIVRTSWLYGLHGRNFLKTMLRLALRQPERAVQVVNDQHGCPTWSYRLAEQMGRILDTSVTGMFHASGQGFCTWYELATHFLDAMRVQHRVVPCTTQDYPTPARRPANSILRNERLAAAGIHLMRDWKDDVDEFVAKHHDALMREAQEL